VTLVALCSISLRSGAQSTEGGAAAAVEFTVSMPRPYTHLLEVEMRVKPGLGADAHVDLVMPVWTPGSYLIREYERHVQDFSAKNAAGQTLPWMKVNKNTWRIAAPRSAAITAAYRVYANDLTVRTNELNDTHAFWNNAGLLMYPDGQLRSASTLRVVTPAGWRVATGLPLAAGRTDTYAAPNFDVLYDSPFEAGTFTTLSFDVNGVPHRIVIDGRGNYDSTRLRDDVKKIVRTEATMMGDIPYHDYTFLAHMRAPGGGGLEHLNSTGLIFAPFGFQPDASYHEQLSLVAHEFFHLWNVKRIRPDALGPFDYTKENYTRLLWVAEGITSYYQDLVLRRAGITTEEEYFDALASTMRGIQETPGRKVMSVEEASFDAWIKYYRQDENAVNSQVSYYDKGGVLGLLLDLEIRKRSAGARSLDTVMRYLYAEFFKKGRNYTPDDFQKAAELAAGSSLESFFARYVHGRAELDYGSALDAVGLRLDSLGTDHAYFGADLAQSGDRLLVTRVYSGTPAYEQGLNANDQIVSINGIRTSKSFFDARMKEMRAGDVLHLSVARFDEQRNIDITPSRRTDGPYRILSIAQPSAEQLRLRRAWLSGQ
jgi:predicted metalloprotease with PDZ domain